MRKKTGILFVNHLQQALKQTSKNLREITESRHLERKDILHYIFD